MKELAIDISHWDGDINLKSWKHDRGMWAVIIKCGGFETNLGRYKDSRYEANYNKAKAIGTHIGAYYYSVATSVGAAKADAEHCIGLLKGHDFDMPIYYDIEDPRQFQLSARSLTDVIKAFCDVINEAGYKAGIYTGSSAWMNNMLRGELYQYADWIAAWRRDWPSYCEDGGTIGMWQQGSMNLASGAIAYADVTGNTDLDWCAIDYPMQITARKTQDSVPNASSKEDAVAKRGSVARLMEIAYDDLGYCASRDPEPGSKAGRYCAKLMGQSWLAGPSTEIWWCCMWVSMIMDKADVKCPGFPSQNTDLAWNGGAKSRAIDKAAIRRGDILIFDWNFNTTATDHIGFATGSPRNGYVSTIEGNVGNAVKEKSRPLSSIRYAIRPLYADAAAQSVTASTNVKNPTQNGKKLDVDGVGGYNTVYEWQAQMGTTRDGEITGQSKADYGHIEGMVAVSFGGGGSQLVRAIQAKVGASVDGYWGRETSTKVQQWLIDRGYSCGSCGADGYFGHDSVCALQWSLNDSAWR